MDESGVSLEKSPVISGEVSSKDRDCISQVVVNDLAGRIGETGEVNDKNIGTILRGLREELEGGIHLDKKGIKVFSSVGEALPQDLWQAMQTAIVYHNEPIPREELDEELGIKRRFFEDRVLGKFFYGDAYEEVLEFHKKLYGENVNVKLVRYNDTLLVVTEHRVGERLRVLQVMDCDFPPTYSEFKRRVWEEDLDVTAWSEREKKKKIDIPVHHLIIEDTQNGKATDLRSLLPDDWELHYRPTTSLMFAQDSDKRYLRYVELLSPESLVAFLHEYGHCVFDANNPLFRETKELWSQAGWTPGGPKALPDDVFIRTKELLVRNERGASARAIQGIRILREQGLNIGAPIAKVIELLNQGLASYERRYFGGTTRFLRPKAEERIK